MIVECIAIILVIVCVFFVFLRAKKRQYALAVLPITIVPLLHFIGEYTKNEIYKIFGLDPQLFLSCVDILSLVGSCLIIGLMASVIPSKKAKTSYVVISGLFLLILVWIFIYNTYTQSNIV